jgi:exonuclease VII small subunit
MDSELENQRLRARVAYLEQFEQKYEQLEQKNEQLEQKNEQLEQTNEQLEQTHEQLEQTHEQLEQTNEQLELSQQITRNTTFSEYLENCHRLLFQHFRVNPDAAGGSVTRVDGKSYPLSLRPWTEFKELQQQQFDITKNILKDEPLFPSLHAIHTMQRLACETPVANEEDIKPFEHIAVEGRVAEVIHTLHRKAEANSSVANLGVFRILFRNHSLTVNLPLEEVVRSDISEGAEKKRYKPSPGVAVEPKEINPDRRCLREDIKGNRAIAFVVEYKAAHKLQANHIRRSLSKDLFTNVIKRCNSNKSSTDSTQSREDSFDQILAMVLTQTFDYMIRLGLEYSYLTAGKSFLFLWIKADDPKTLYYYLADPDKDAEDKNGQLRESKTAVAQVVSFSLLALGSEIRSQSWTAKAQAVLNKWPTPYPGMEQEATNNEEQEATDSEEVSRSPSNSSDLSYCEEVVVISKRKIALHSKSTCKAPDTDRGRKDDTDDADGSNRPSSHNPWSGPSSTDSQTKRKQTTSSCTGSSRFEETSNTKEQSRQYCTIGCLMGLKRGQKLDMNCPNIASHRIAAGSITHPISIEGLAGLMQEQLACSLDRDCEPLEMDGKYGATGILFKLSLTRYGYTFVGKGTIPELVPCLADEVKIYHRLERLQGEVVPICLGSINLTKPYHLTARHAIRFAGFKIVHMLLMSWAGELAIKAGVDLTTEIAQSLRMVRGEGVVHHDLRDANLLWNEERGRVMVIDFDRADLIPLPKPKQMSRLSKGKGKWTGYKSEIRDGKRIY